MKREVMDYLIRDTLRHEVMEQEPSPSVREALLAQASNQNATGSDAVVGPSTPPLVSGLREPGHLQALLGWHETESDPLEVFGSSSQGLVSLWLLAMPSRY